MKAYQLFQKIDRYNIQSMHKYGSVFLRFSLALVFIWFGILKPLGLSPAQELVEKTVFWFSPDWFFPLLGWWEVAIGIFLLFRPTLRLALLLLFLQIPGTFLPLLILPEVTFTQFPYGLTLEGQYIIKNLILIAAAISVGGTVNLKDSPEEIH